MSMNELTPAQRVQKESLAVISHAQYRPLGGIVMMGKTEMDDAVRTAETDGMNTWFNPGFVAQQGVKELRFLILHEAMHKAKRDLITWVHLWEEDAYLANLSCDYVNNLELVKSDPSSRFIAMPPQGALDQRFDGMDAGEVFRILKQEGKKDDGTGPQPLDAHKWEEASKLTPEQVQKVEREVATALQQGLLFSKNMAGGLERMVRDILEPEVDWRQELREFAITACSGKELSTWRRPNRRSLDRGVYLPSSYSETVRRMVIAVDTSGSISGTIISTFLGAVSQVARTIQPEVLDLLYWDTQVAAHEKYGQGEYESLIASTKPVGGGGTSPSCVSSYLQEQRIQPECVLVLTDGVVSNWGYNWPAPVLWCVIGHRHITAPNGKTLHIRGE